MADFLDVTAGNDKRKQLLAWLMQQISQQGGSSDMAGGALQAASSLAPAHVGAGGLRTIFNRSDTRRSDPSITHPSQVGQGLGLALGPGGFGHPGAHEHSAGPGLPVAPLQRPVAPPRGGPNRGGPILPVRPTPPPFAQQALTRTVPANQRTVPANQLAPGVVVFDPNSLTLKRI